MRCLECGAVVHASKGFCTDCGLLLLADSSETLLTLAVNGCQECGAAPEYIDGKGFCAVCGHLQAPPAGRDHLELTALPHLGGVTDRGFRHTQNEDYLALQHLTAEQVSLLVVCDGISSSTDADIASKAAAEAACRTLTRAVQTGVTEDVVMMLNAIAAAQDAVADIPQTGGVSSATTIVAALVSPRTATLGWVGDSRAYWVDRQGGQLLTSDHNWLNYVVAAGTMTEEAARREDKAHALVRWLGADAGAHAIPSIIRFHLPGPGHLVLCSDGLWGYVPRVSQFARLFHELAIGATDAITIAQRLVDFARNQGGRDNITAVVLAVEPEAVA